MKHLRRSPLMLTDRRIAVIPINFSIFAIFAYEDLFSKTLLCYCARVHKLCVLYCFKKYNDSFVSS